MTETKQYSQEEKAHASGFIKRQTDFISHNGNQDVFVLDTSKLGEKSDEALSNLVKAFETLGSQKTEDNIGQGRAVMTNSKDLGLAGITDKLFSVYHGVTY